MILIDVILALMLMKIINYKDGDNSRTNFTECYFQESRSLLLFCKFFLHLFSEFRFRRVAFIELLLGKVLEGEGA